MTPKQQKALTGKISKKIGSDWLIVNIGPGTAHPQHASGIMAISDNSTVRCVDVGTGYRVYAVNQGQRLERFWGKKLHKGRGRAANCVAEAAAAVAAIEDLRA